MSDLDSLIQLCSSSEGMKDLGWNSLATIDGTNCFDLNSIKEEAHNSSLDIFDDVWICQPILSAISVYLNLMKNFCELSKNAPISAN